jgi:ATP-binding cassette subfamily C protein/ATP-binding cassette subfamily C exporter for protease/lipase/ATP-binding cassette subfamily C protein EexD
MGMSFFIALLYLSSSLYMMQVYDRVLASGSIDTLLMLTLLLIVSLLALAALESTRGSVLSRMASWMADALRPAVLDRVLGRVDAPRSAQPMRDLRQIQQFFSGQGVAPLLDAPWAPIFMVLIWVLHPVLGLLALGSAGVLIALGFLNERMTRKGLERAMAGQAQAFAGLETMLRNSEIIRALGMGGPLRERWSRVEDASNDAQEKSSDLGSALQGAIKFVRLLSQSAVLGVGALLVLEGKISAGSMIAASILLGRALAPAEALVGAWRLCIGALASFKRLQALLAATPDLPEGFPLPPPKGELLVDKVLVRLEQDAPPILRQVSFALAAGESLGVIGPSGCGKTTLCRVLTGVAPPLSGEVRLDGAELGHWNPGALGRHLGYLPQAVELFEGTVAENIARMGEPDFNAVLAAAELADVHRMILKLPQGYDTVLRDNGAGLSAGQRQRIGLARALYGSPSLIVLDEPNAHLDQAGEEALRATLARLKEQRRTVVIVAHRRAALSQVDKLLILQEGAVAAFGPRDAVLAELARQQNQQASGDPRLVPLRSGSVV